MATAVCILMVAVAAVTARSTCDLWMGYSLTTVGHGTVMALLRERRPAWKCTISHDMEWADTFSEWQLMARPFSFHTPLGDGAFGTPLGAG